jgi:hypothetical protein
MGLIGGMARTAVVAGTATAVSNRVSRRQARRWGAQEQQAYEQDYPPPPQQEVYYPPQEPPAAAPPEDMSSKLDQLKQLGELKAQGLLTELEFEQQKARILGS